MHKYNNYVPMLFTLTHFNVYIPTYILGLIISDYHDISLVYLYVVLGYLQLLNYVNSIYDIRMTWIWNYNCLCLKPTTV